MESRWGRNVYPVSGGVVHLGSTQGVHPGCPPGVHPGVWGGGVPCPGLAGKYDSPEA